MSEDVNRLVNQDERLYTMYLEHNEEFRKRVINSLIDIEDAVYKIPKEITIKNVLKIP